MIPESLRTALHDTYRIERELGAGGMATVYLARDLRHDRLVALKVLRPDLSAVLGADRFLAEIRTTATLQHPHILGLIDSGQADGMVFYVMPYVAGESLRDRLTREKQLPVDDAVRITTEVAHALDYAHRQGIIHRDIKPENILLQDGQAMVADFGIALAATQAVGGRMTETGMSLGTPQYMSPEQALGERDLTPRSDQYALACVLYELLAGEPPFTGPTVQAIVARVMTAEPESITTRRPATPASVAAALSRALQKVPADRFKSCAEFAEALRMESRTASAPRFAGSTGAWPQGRVPSVATATLGIALIAAVGALGALMFREDRGTQEAVRFEIPVPPGLRLPPFTAGRPFDISPDGRTLVFAAVANDSQAGSPRVSGIYARTLEALEPRLIAPGAARFFSFSRDGQEVAYISGTSLMRVDLSSGVALRLGELKQYLRGISWGAAGIVVGATTGGLVFFPEGGGKPIALTAVPQDSLVWHMHPLVLPDERHVVFAVRTGADFQLALVSVTDTTVTPLGAGTFPVAMVGDQLLYALSDGELVVAPLNLKRRTLGKPASIGITVDTDPDFGAAAALSTAGTLVYSTGGQLSVPFGSTSEGLSRSLAVEPRPFFTARFSPSGNQIAFDVQRAGGADIWLLNRRTGTMERMTTDEGFNIFPEWSPDGLGLLYTRYATPPELWWRRTDGSEPPSRLHRPPFEFTEGVMSPDGTWLLYRTAATGRYMRDVIAVPRDSTDRREVAVEVGPFNEYGPRFSPDGRWIAYSSNLSGRQEIYVRPFPGPGPRVQVTSAGGGWPVWGRSGRALYFLRGQDVLKVSIRGDHEFVVTSTPATVARGARGGGSHAPYDVSPDEREVIAIRSIGDAPFTVVLNWLAELQRGSAASAR